MARTARQKRFDPMPRAPVARRPLSSWLDGAARGRRLGTTLVGLVVLGLSLGAGLGCNRDGVSREELEGLKAQHADALARLERLEKARAAPSAAAVPSAPRAPDGSKVYAVSVGKSPQRGPADAWVTIVEISDFQCPFCARGAATLKQVEEAYKGDVRVVFKHNPLSFHPRALPAAIATGCAHAQGKFWPLADALFADQSKLGDADLEAAARNSGVNLAAWSKCVAQATPKAEVDADQLEAAKFGARGTPAFFINGRFLSGAQPLQSFKAIVDEELKKAKTSGVARGKVYAELVEAKGATSL